MHILVLGTFLMLDGATQAPGGPDENTSGGFEHGHTRMLHCVRDDLGWEIASRSLR